MTKEERIQKVSEIVAPFEKMVSNLFQRWQCEKEYEDFKDYSNYMKEKVGITFIKATKRPFGFIMSVNVADEVEFPYNVQVYCGSSHYGWKAVSKR